MRRWWSRRLKALEAFNRSDFDRDDPAAVPARVVAPAVAVCSRDRVSGWLRLLNLRLWGEARCEPVAVMFHRDETTSTVDDGASDDVGPRGVS